MKRRIVTIACLLALSGMAVFVIGAGDKDQATKKQVRGCCAGCMMNPKTGEKNADVEPQAMMQRCMKMMQKAGVTPAMMQRCQVMMRTPIFADSPCAIYGQADVLRLSEGQKKQLMNIENEARRKALAVLTDEQVKKMGDISEKPMPMAQMCQQMCSKMMPIMQNMMGGDGKTGPMMTCPMMCMMGGKGQECSMMCPMMQTAPGDNDPQAKSSEQVTCPVMGGPINKDIYTEYKGKNVYFCCPMCKGKFEADSDAYLEKLPQFKQ